MRRMSFALTTDAILNRTKTVTRRLGWSYLKPGDRLLAVDKLRTKNARKLGVIEVVSTRWEKLYDIGEDDVRREGVDTFDYCDANHATDDFPPTSDCAECFLRMFVAAMGPHERKDFERCGGYNVNRIEFRYVEERTA